MTESLLGREAGGVLVSVVSTVSDTTDVHSRISGTSTCGIDTLNADCARFCGARYESGLNKLGRMTGIILQ